MHTVWTEEPLSAKLIAYHRIILSLLEARSPTLPSVTLLRIQQYLTDTNFP